MTDRLGFSASILSMIGILSITVVEVGAGTIITKPIASDIWYINAPKGSGSSRVYNVIEYSGSQLSNLTKVTGLSHGT